MEKDPNVFHKSGLGSLWRFSIFYNDWDLDVYMDKTSSNRLLVLIKNMSSLYGRKRFLLRVTYIPTNVSCFLRVEWRVKIYGNKCGRRCFRKF